MGICLWGGALGPGRWVRFELSVLVAINRFIDLGLVQLVREERYLAVIRKRKCFFEQGKPAPQNWMNPPN